MTRKGRLRHLDFIVIDILALFLSATIGFLATEPSLYNLLENWMIYPFFSFINLSACLLLRVYDGILQRGYLKEFVALIKQEFFIAAVLILILNYKAIPGAVIFHFRCFNF